MNLTKKFLGTVLTVAAVGMMGCPPKTTEEDVVANKLSMEAGTAKINGKEVAYDMKSGKDCFKLYFEENFEQKNLDELLAVELPSGEKGTNGTTKAWFAQTSWNNDPKGVEVSDGEMRLYAERVAEDYKTPNAQNIPGEPDNWRQIIGSICGGVTFNKMVKYGYIEAEVMVPPKKYSEYWCGFYSEGLKTTTEDGKKKAVAGYEFDIFEPMGPSEIEQPTHYRALEPGIRLATIQKKTPLVNNQWIKAAVAWTPDKVAYYIDGQLTYVLYADNHNKAVDAVKQSNIENGKAKDVAQNHEYQIIPNIPQEIILVIAAGDGFGPITGAALPRFSQQEIGTREMVYKYNSFKYYEYVGTEE